MGASSVPVQSGARPGGTLQAIFKARACWRSLSSLCTAKITLKSRSHVPEAGLEHTQGRALPAPAPAPAGGAALRSEGAVVPRAQGHSAGPCWAGWEADPAHGVTAIAPGPQGITRQTPLLGLCCGLTWPAGKHHTAFCSPSLLPLWNGGKK